MLVQKSPDALTTHRVSTPSLLKTRLLRTMLAVNELSDPVRSTSMVVAAGHVKSRIPLRKPDREPGLDRRVGMGDDDAAVTWDPGDGCLDSRGRQAHHLLARVASCRCVGARRKWRVDV